jgi:superfamily II DNA/RNA helicase
MGKTAVYVVVTLERICREDGLQCVVVVHTRELAYQVSKEFERFKTYLEGIHVECIYGGVPLPQQQAKLKEQPPHVIVACPGRLKLLIEKGIVDVSKLKVFVIDEVDKVLEKMDMREDVQRIFYKTPKNKQTMCFSATMPPEIKSTIMKFVRNVSIQHPSMSTHCNIRFCCDISIDSTTAVFFEEMLISKSSSTSLMDRPRARNPSGVGCNTKLTLFSPGNWWASSRHFGAG